MVGLGGLGLVVVLVVVLGDWVMRGGGTVRMMDVLPTTLVSMAGIGRADSTISRHLSNSISQRVDRRSCGVGEMLAGVDSNWEVVEERTLAQRNREAGKSHFERGLDGKVVG